VIFRLAHIALQNVNKDYVIFSYFRNFVAKSDHKRKTKNEMNETLFKRQAASCSKFLPTSIKGGKRSHQMTQKTKS
jgi:hypothetical protein